MGHREKQVPCYSIMGRWKYDCFDFTSPDDFILLFQGVVDVRSIKDNPNISQYCVDEKRSYLVESQNALPIHKSDVCPFYYLAQFKFAKRLHVLTHQQLHMLASSAVNSHVQVVLLSNTGRCGSTLLVQMLESAGCVYALSEPDNLSNIQTMYSMGKLTQEETKRMLTDAFSLFQLGAHLNGMKIAVIKTRSWCLGLVPLINQCLPAIKHLFMYRQGMDTITSFLIAFKDSSIVKVPNSSSKCAQMRAEHDDYAGRLTDIVDAFTLFAQLWIQSMASYLEMRKEMHVPIMGVKYEKLLAEPLSTLISINRACNLKLTGDQLQHCLTAMNRHSQRSVIPSSVRKSSSEGFSHPSISKLDALCRSLGVPLLESNESVDGTISPSP